MRRACAGMAGAFLFGPSLALAGGGAHVVDDAAVETPGRCHLENWATLASGRAGLVNIAPACTLRSLPMVEWGGFAAHGWTLDDNDTLIGLSPKIALRPEETGLGIGISTSFAYGVDRHRIESASAIIPLTIPVSRQMRFNINAGWQWTRIATEHDVFVGGQAEWMMGQNLTLMGEAFARDRGRIGGQAGLRWTTANGHVDLDMLAGRYLDGETPAAFTIGVTLR